MIIKSESTNKKIVWVMNINEYKINSNFSWALIQINWNHWTIKSINEDRIYFIIAWKGIFIINWIENDVTIEDLVFIPRNTPYNITWNLKYFLVCSPEFNKENDVRLD